MTPLDRLLNSAAAAPARPVTELPFAREARVLAAWRTARDGAGGAGNAVDAEALVRFCRRALALAGLVAVLALAVVLGSGPDADPYSAGAQALDAAYSIASSQ